MTRRILFVSHYALPHLGGIETIIDGLARELVRRGHEVTHLASAAQSVGAKGVAGPDGQHDYRVVRLPASNVLEARAGVPYPVFGPLLLRRLRRELARADVLHAHGILYMSSVAATALAGRQPHRPVRALTEHVGHVSYESRALDQAQAAALATLGRWSARTADGVVVYNEKVGREVARWAPGTPVEFISNGIDADRYRPPGTGERERLRRELGWDDRPRALFVGRLVAKKGAAVAIAAAGAAAGAFELMLVGPGRLEGEIPPHVTALGPQPPERVAALYRAADVFLLPSRGEGFPVTAQEAMASGLPLVLGDDPAYEPHVRGAGSGVHLVAPDAELIAATVTDLVRDDEGRAQAGQSAADHARRAFSWARCADAHEDLWDRLRARRERGVGLGQSR